MKKIAILEPVGGHGGMNYYDFGLAGGIAANNQVILYTSEETYVPKDLLFEVKKSFKGVWGEAPKLFRAYNFFYGLISSIVHAKINKIDIIHYHFFHYTIIEIICVKLAKLLLFKVVITAHDVESFSGARNIKKAHKVFMTADIVIAHNKVSKDELISKIRLPNDKIVIIPHGNYINTTVKLPSKKVARNKFNLFPDDKIILFFGQIKKVKGLEILLRSLPDVIKVYPKFKLIIAGKVWKDDFSNYETIIKDLGLCDKVISHIRYIPDDMVPYYYQAADLVVLPYKRIYQSGVLLMAMSYKVPVLVSNIPGMTEIISDCENGFIFNMGNSESLSRKLKSILSEQESLLRVKNVAFNQMLSYFSWDRIGKMTSDVYEKL